MSKPLQISPDTAIKLSKQLNVPIERLMHMPRHILLQKLAELAKSETGSASAEAGGASIKPDEGDPSPQ